MYKVYIDGEVFCDSRVDELAIIDPVITLEVNAAGSFVFTIPPGHPKYDAIKRRKSVISVYRDEESEPIFQGICTEEGSDFYKQKKITCEGELTYLNDSIQRPASYQGITVLELLATYIANHNQQVDDFKKFEIGTVTVKDFKNSISCYTNMNSTMSNIKKYLVDDFGGYIRVRYAGGKKYIDYLADSPAKSTQTIELGKNLMNFSSNIDNTEIATAIIPLGATLKESGIEGLDTKLTIASVNGGADYLYSQNAVDTYGWITNTVEWSNVTSASELKTKGQQYLEDVQFEKVVIQASAVDFGNMTDDINKFKLLDSIHVISKPHGMNRYFVLTKQTLNLNNPEKDVITLGMEEKVSLSARNNAANTTILKAIEQIMPSSDIIKMSVEQATNVINGVKGGHVVINMDENGQPYELLILDTDDINTAKKVWRWNVNGLGYSSTGYNGSYGTAMTMDGAIVADRITTGTLSCDRLNGGTFTAGGSDNTNGQIIVKNADGETVAALDADGLTTNSANITGGSISDWNINNNAIYKDVVDSDDENIVYRIYLQPPHQGSINSTWVLSCQKSTDAGNTFYGNFVLNSDGSVIFGDEKIKLNPDGSALFSSGAIAMQSDGTASFSDGKLKINADGNISLDNTTGYNGAFTIGNMTLTFTSGILVDVSLNGGDTNE